METNYEKYRNELLKNPEFQVKYYLAKEKLNIELMLDSIDEAINQKSSILTMKRRVSKLRNYITTLSL
jgi:hypothetical protein